MKEQEETDGLFEREWREAFANANEEPPKIVWSEIDRELAHGRVDGYKKRAAYYQWAAAAVLVIASTLGLVEIFSGDTESNSVELASNYNAENEVLEAKGGDETRASYNSGSAIDDLESSGSYNAFLRAAEGSGYGAMGEAGFGQNKTFQTFATITVFDSRDGNNSIDGDGGLGEDPDENIYSLQSKSPQLVMDDPQLRDQLYMVANTSNAVHNKRRSSQDNVEDRYWAGLDVNSGTFDPNFQNASSSLNSSLLLNPGSQFTQVESDVLSSVDPAVQETMSSGQMMAFGIDMGMRLSDKWSVHGGFQYMQADATNNTNMVVASTQIVETIAVTKQVRGVTQVQDIVQQEEIVRYSYEDIELDNQFQFASIPVNVGYRLLDNKVSVELNGGVAANIYLGNKLSDSNDQVADVTIGPGSNSPYKQFSFMGLAGVQFGYEFISHFDILVQPNYRHSLNNLTKGSSDFVASPSGFGLQTGIRYRFD
ncbi:hypothetical protein [Marinoscillum sp. MHG1-6]|uniref:hypothetical protein n=1 Tax=Marinoscillum sp. MHG1-6 TaxID=2959627 RepID=UPI0021587517|nr:hypothetical protein [Marinoscillum sp. MHG1-6]